MSRREHIIAHFVSSFANSRIEKKNIKWLKVNLNLSSWPHQKCQQIISYTISIKSFWRDTELIDIKDNFISMNKSWTHSSTLWFVHNWRVTVNIGVNYSVTVWFSFESWSLKATYSHIQGNLLQIIHNQCLMVNVLFDLSVLSVIIESSASQTYSNSLTIDHHYRGSKSKQWVEFIIAFKMTIES